jgi:hypothetical protein
MESKNTRVSVSPIEQEEKESEVDQDQSEVGKELSTQPAEFERQSTGQYPEHEKLHANTLESHVLSGFLDMLDERHIFLATYHEHESQCYDEEKVRQCGLSETRLYDYFTPTKEQLIGLYLGIDPKKLSAEKEAMYQELIAANAQRNNTSVSDGTT